MAKLHEVLAVEGDKEGIAKKMLGETEHVFKEKHALFQGMTRSLKMLEETEANKALEEASFEELQMTTTVKERLAYTEKALIPWLDVVFQKEVTNQTDAKADIEIDGVVIASEVPATFLLGLETKLKQVRKAYEAIPTLPPGIRWERDEAAGEDIWRSVEPEVRNKTQKVPQFRVMYEATPEHPAQIEKWAEDVTVGKIETHRTTSAMPAAKKSELLERTDKMIQAVKQARMRANSVTASKRVIAEDIFKYIRG